MNRTALLAAGFESVTNGAFAGESFKKRQPIETLPYANDHVVDGEYVTEGMMAITEVLPDGRVQLRIPDGDYIEGPVSGEEALGLLKDAGVVFDEPARSPGSPKP